MSILAALSPSIVIPNMLKFTSPPMSLGYTPQTVLNSAPLEVVLADFIFNVLAALEQATPNPFLPWVHILPLWANCVLIPVKIVFSFAVGGSAGYAIARYYRYRHQRDVRREKGLIEAIAPSHESELLLVLLAVCYLLFALSTNAYIQQCSGILTVFSCAIVVSGYAPQATLESLRGSLESLWTFLEIALFTSTGANLSLRFLNGPQQSMRGLSGSDAKLIVGILVVGQLGRAGGIALSGALCLFRQAPQRRSLRYSVRWWLATWMFTIPKATVQATLGSLPYSFHIIAGSDGLARALFIQVASAFSILICSTVGVLLTQLVGLPLARQLADMDEVVAAAAAAAAAAESTGESQQASFVGQVSPEGDVELQSEAHGTEHAQHGGGRVL